MQIISPQPSILPLHTSTGSTALPSPFSSLLLKDDHSRGLASCSLRATASVRSWWWCCICFPHSFSSPVLTAALCRAHSALGQLTLAPGSRWQVRVYACLQDTAVHRCSLMQIPWSVTRGRLAQHSCWEPCSFCLPLWSGLTCMSGFSSPSLLICSLTLTSTSNNLRDRETCQCQEVLTFSACHG